MHYEDVKIKCPFYLEKQMKPHAINCEGVGKDSVVTITFRGKKEKYIKMHCAKYDSDCLWRKALNAKYKDEV